MVISERETAKENLRREMRELQSELTTVNSLMEESAVVIRRVENDIYPSGSNRGGRHEASFPPPSTSRNELNSQAHRSYFSGNRYLSRLRDRANSARAEAFRRSGFENLRVAGLPFPDPRFPGFGNLRSGDLPPRDPSHSGSGNLRPRYLLTRGPHHSGFGNLGSRDLPPRDPAIAEYYYNPATFRYDELTLKQACSVMVTFDLDVYYENIKQALCKFSVRIYGLEECRREDIRLAVFLFVEKYFSFQPVIELCVKHIPDVKDPNVIGVLFERTATVTYILQNAKVLENTNFQVMPNFNPYWIVRNYDDCGVPVNF